MHVRRHTYLVNVQYLGFRYSGWQKQPGQKTVEEMITKTLRFIMPERKVKILGSGRTDAKVSALHMAFELFIEGNDIDDISFFLEKLNTNLPPDIRAIDIEKVNEPFNIIKDIALKEYVYLFSYGKKNHPFCAPFLANVLEDLDIGLMRKAAKSFEGTHDFSSYTVKRKNITNTVRTIDSCLLEKNDILTANFFPKVSYALKVKGKGFMRYQIRLIMGVLIQLGRGELSIDEIERSLKKGNTFELTYVAPGSGLLLNHLEFRQSHPE